MINKWPSLSNKASSILQDFQWTWIKMLQELLKKMKILMLPFWSPCSKKTTESIRLLKNLWTQSSGRGMKTCHVDSRTLAIRATSTPSFRFTTIFHRLCRLSWLISMMKFLCRHWSTSAKTRTPIHSKELIFNLSNSFRGWKLLEHWLGKLRFYLDIWLNQIRSMEIQLLF